MRKRNHAQAYKKFICRVFKLNILELIWLYQITEMQFLLQFETWG
jgi:hypothetical protein